MSPSTASSSAKKTPTVVPYRHVCPTCARAFQRATGLERHRRSAHSKEKNYACEFCSQAYSRIDLLQRHVSLYHKQVAADKGRMQGTTDLVMAQQSTMPPQSSMQFTSQPVPTPDFPRSTIEFNSLMAPSSVTQQQQQSPLPLVNCGIDQDMLNWFNETPSSLSEMLPDEPVTTGLTHANSLSMASTLPSPALPWASSDFTAPLSTYFPGGSSGSNSAPASILTSLNLSPGIDALRSSSLGDASIDGALNFLSPPQSTTVSSASMDLSSISDSEMWPLPEPSHLDAYRQNFAPHLPFIHLPSISRVNTADELEADLCRAMTMVGGNYEPLSPNAQEPGDGSLSNRSTMKPCDYYGCVTLKAKTIRCIESMPDQLLGGPDSSVQVLLRRTQTMILLQIVAMFSEVKTHRVSAKLSHGALVAIARELLQHVSFGEYGISWVEWIRREEIIRTLWSVYLLDCLQSFCYRRRPGLSLSELSHLPDLGPDDLWLAATEIEFNERAAQATTTRESVFGFMLSLKETAPPAMPGCLSLSGQLLVVTTLVTEIMATVQADTAMRRQLANRLRGIMSTPKADHIDDLRVLAQAVDRSDAHLRSQVDSDNRQLMRWLSLLHHSTPRPNMQDKGCTPFIRDFMPWYWAGIHLLGVLRGRLGAGCSDPNQLHDRLASYSTQSQGNMDAINDASIEVMHLLVRIRLSLGILDGGAKMQSAIGSVDFAAALPPLPEYLATISIAGLFPPFSASNSPWL
ncbi:Hypothetical protein R9X50_00099000 [Acrodontium crateriforme]|uniref:C2H2-type domain-containing protein n=1 Tax=Acrodontium crateriforme TaxID=150365 RepID=A0AAQ3LYB5_9PEZI|nr:Hypothetical protein R9X50_00099000 [Acrodontium crateriforme]